MPKNGKDGHVRYIAINGTDDQIKAAKKFLQGKLRERNKFVTLEKYGLQVPEGEDTESTVFFCSSDDGVASLLQEDTYGLEKVVGARLSTRIVARLLTRNSEWKTCLALADGDIVNRLDGESFLARLQQQFQKSVRRY